MATAIEYGAIAAGIAVAVIAIVQVANTVNASKPENVRAARIDEACKKPTPDNRRREIAWVETENGGKGGYVVCPIPPRPAF